MPDDCLLKRPLWAPGWLSLLSVWLSVFGSGHDLQVGGIELRVGLCADGTQPAWGSLSLSLSAPPLLTRALSLP